MNLNQSNASDAVFDSQQPPSPVACWRFDQCNSSGSVVIRDHSGLELQRTMIRGVTCQKGRFGYAGFFDGVDDLVEIPDQPIFHFTNQMTVTAWVKPLRLDGITYGLQTIVNKWYAMDSYILLIDKGNYVFSVAFPGGQWGSTVNVSAPATVDVWAHVAGVFNGQHIFLYLNGQLAAQVAAKGRLQDSHRPICIGNHPSWNAFMGLIEEVRLYNVALNASQIQELFSVTDQQRTPLGAAVLGGLLGVQKRLVSANVAERIAALSEAMKYGQKGLGLVMQALKDEVEQVRQAAFGLLHQRTEASGKQALEQCIPLNSAVGVNYTRLQELLAAGHWRQADDETAKKMLEVMGRENSGSLSLSAQDVRNFPCEDLCTIDRLWVAYSKGRFGFSVQKRIWNSVDKHGNSFGERVGWLESNNRYWLYYTDYHFTIEAPPGHLPSWWPPQPWGVWCWWWLVDFFDRIESCGL